MNHDLHTHTVWSDGAHPIPLHILESRAFELDAMAITNHWLGNTRWSQLVLARAGVPPQQVVDPRTLVRHPTKPAAQQRP